MKFKCPYCNQSYKITEEEQIGCQFICNGCNNLIEVPSLIEDTVYQENLEKFETKGSKRINKVIKIFTIWNKVMIWLMAIIMVGAILLISGGMIANICGDGDEGFLLGALFYGDYVLGTVVIGMIDWLGTELIKTKLIKDRERLLQLNKLNFK